MQVSRYSAPRSRAKPDQRDARHVDRQVQQKIARAQQRLEHLPVIFAGQRGLHEFDAELLGFGSTRILGGHDGDAIRRSADVTQDQRQDSLSDAAEADEYDPARKIHMHCVFAHQCFPVLTMRSREQR